MKHFQYSVRNVPEPVDTYLRKQAQQSGRSLNQVIIDELAQRVAPSADNIQTGLSWFIGSGLDSATLVALDEDEAQQKRIAARDL